LSAGCKKIVISSDKSRAAAAGEECLRLGLKKAPQSRAEPARIGRSEPTTVWRQLSTLFPSLRLAGESLPASRCQRRPPPLDGPVEQSAAANGQVSLRTRTNLVIPTAAGAPATAEWRDLVLSRNQGEEGFSNGRIQPRSGERMQPTACAELVEGAKAVGSGVKNVISTERGERKTATLPGPSASHPNPADAAPAPSHLLVPNLFETPTEPATLPA